MGRLVAWEDEARPTGFALLRLLLNLNVDWQVIARSPVLAKPKRNEVDSPAPEIPLSDGADLPYFATLEGYAC